MAAQAESTRLVSACPECDFSGINQRKSQLPEWVCHSCGHEFDDPIYRPPKDRGHPGDGFDTPRTCGLCGGEVMALFDHLQVCPARDSIGSTAAGGAD